MIRAGESIAIKVPRYKWAETAAIYRDRVGLGVVSRSFAEAAWSNTMASFAPKCAETRPYGRWKGSVI